MVFLTRRERFNAAHCLFNDKWSEEKNKEVFGKCCNRNFHGHNFDIFVTVRGEPNEETGFVMNAHTLSKIVKEQIADKLDHKNLNLDIDEFKTTLPSTENLAIVVWNWLKPHITECELHCIKIYETENIYVEYYG